MRKAGVLVFIFLLTLIAFSISVSAANETFVEKAYSCLQSKVKDKCSSLSFEEQAFTILALGSDCKSAFMSKSKNSGECWPSSGCTIKDTSLAILALKRINADISKAESWLSKNNITPADLDWYLEIDSSSAVSCTISYDTKNVKIKIGDNKKISSFSDACLSLAADNNWMKISTSCLKKKFTVSCDQGFISSILYKKPSSNVWRVSPSAQSGSAGGQTTHEINFYCYSTGTSCSYEDNLWATLAIQSLGEDAKGTLPYLVALSEDNEKFFPETFLYIITADDEYVKAIVDNQKQEGYWNLNNNKFYSTAEAMLALSDSDAENSAKSWLENNHDSSGCWGGISDTAFLLWVGWPNAVSGEDEGTIQPDCEVAGHYYCITPKECDDVSGTPSNFFSCEGRAGINVCCDKDKSKETCLDMSGQVCPSGQTCSVLTISTYDETDCCLNDCIPATSACENNQGSCVSSCLASEEELAYDCGSGQVCCKAKAVSPVASSSSKWWIWLLVILIILVVIAIIFRNHLRLFLFKFKGKTGSSPVNKTRPPFFPPSQQPGFRQMPRPLMPGQPRQMQKSASKTDKDLDETFRKLREMSK